MRIYLNDLGWSNLVMFGSKLKKVFAKISKFIKNRRLIYKKMPRKLGVSVPPEKLIHQPDLFGSLEP